MMKINDEIKEKHLNKIKSLYPGNIHTFCKLDELDPTYILEQNLELWALAFYNFIDNDSIIYALYVNRKYDILLFENNEVVARRKEFLKYKNIMILVEPYDRTINMYIIDSILESISI